MHAVNEVCNEEIATITHARKQARTSEHQLCDCWLVGAEYWLSRIYMEVLLH